MKNIVFQDAAYPYESGPISSTDRRNVRTSRYGYRLGGVSRFINFQRNCVLSMFLELSLPPFSIEFKIFSKSFAATMQKLIPEISEDDKPVKLLKLASAAYRKAFGSVVPGIDVDMGDDKEEEKNSARRTTQNSNSVFLRYSIDYLMIFHFVIP